MGSQYGPAPNGRPSDTIRHTHREAIVPFASVPHASPWQQGSDWPQSYKGSGKGQQSAWHQPPRAATAWGEAVVPMQVPNKMSLPMNALQLHHAGVVKSFNEKKGYGFITPTGQQFGKDLFVMRTGVKDGVVLNAGDEVQFKIKMGQKGYEADEVHVVPNIQELSGQTFSGSIKSYVASSGWGFIESESTKRMFGRDIFFHKRDLGDYVPTNGEEVEFQLGKSNKGHPQATNLIFGSGGGGSQLGKSADR